MENASESKKGYAIRFTPQLLALINESLPFLQVGQAASTDRPPTPPPPNAVSVQNDDIQKDRWDKKVEGFGRRLSVENMHKYRHHFEFDAVLNSIDGHPLEGPFVYHLHDSYPKSVIWIRKPKQPARMKAALEEITASGTYTFAVQFKDSTGTWRSLEYDLDDFNGGELQEYNSP